MSCCVLLKLIRVGKVGNLVDDGYGEVIIIINEFDIWGVEVGEYMVCFFNL